MADNYLEYQMENLRNGRAPQPRRPKNAGKGRLFLGDVAVADADKIKLLVAQGYEVWFTHADLHEGSRLARTLRCRFAPPGLPVPEDAVRVRLDSV